MTADTQQLERQPFQGDTEEELPRRSMETANVLPDFQRDLTQGRRPGSPKTSGKVVQEPDGSSRFINDFGIEEIRGPSRSRQPVLPAVTAGDVWRRLEDGFILAADKEYLGKITRNKFDPKSILNDAGSYGSSYSSTSIFNEFGQYGSDSGGRSPFNEFAINPPKVYTRDGELIGWLTVNEFKSPRIDPHVLIAVLKSR